MDIEDVESRLAEIAGAGSDAEAAHGMQDDLLFDALRAIAGGETENAAALALAVLRVVEIKFDRYMA